MKKQIKVHLGCGKRDFGPDWFHVDGSNFPHVTSNDIVNLPFEKNSVDVIYASHVLEYFDREEATEVLGKWYSVLKNEGVIRLAVPDFEIISELYNSKRYDLNSFVGPLYGKMEMAGENIYHKTTYDFNSLKQKLSSVGFYSIMRYDWRTTEHSEIDDHSQAYLPHMNKETGTLISINVEAKK